MCLARFAYRARRCTLGCSVLLWVLGLIRFVSNGSTRLLNSVKLSYRFHLDLCCVKKKEPLGRVGVRHSGVKGSVVQGL